MPGISPIVAVIQARMSSSRLPGKVLMPIAGKPLIWHLVHRLRQCHTLDDIAVATSTAASDDPLAAFCAQEGIACVRGSLDNVLDRYRLAAEETGARTLLRITGDSPLIDPGFIDYLVAGIAAGEGDFVQLAPGARCAHEGVDVLSRRALDWLVRHAGDDPVAREHVTSWFKLHPEVVKTVVLAEYPPLAVDHARLSVDTADDLALIRAVYDRLGALPGEVALTDVLRLLQDEPRYRDINAHVRQKAMTQRERHALILCQGGGNFGLGHLRRSLALARALRDEQGFGVLFAAPAEIGSIIHDAGFSLRTGLLPRDVATERKFDLAIADVKDSLTREDVAMLAARIAAVAVIDDGTDRRLAATHAYYPPVPQACALDWTGSECKARIGWEWCVLGFDPAHWSRQREAGRIVVSMGGSDPLGLTQVAVEALKQLSARQADFIIGPAFAAPQVLASQIDRVSPSFHALTEVRDLPAVFARAELALVAFGVTACELAGLGVPAIYLPMSQDHLDSASAFVEAGMGEVLPLGASPEQIAHAVERLLMDEARCQSMAAAGPRRIDGRAASRIAADLAQVVAAA
jgi:spore coat polysaccharide biosynthesis protein SpsF